MVKLNELELGYLETYACVSYVKPSKMTSDKILNMFFIIDHSLKTGVFVLNFSKTELNVNKGDIVYIIGKAQRYADKIQIKATYVGIYPHIDAKYVCDDSISLLQNLQLSLLSENYIPDTVSIAKKPIVPDTLLTTFSNMKAGMHCSTIMQVKAVKYQANNKSLLLLTDYTCNNLSYKPAQYKSLDILLCTCWDDLSQQVLSLKCNDIILIEGMQLKINYQNNIEGILRSTKSVLSIIETTNSLVDDLMRHKSTYYESVSTYTKICNPMPLQSILNKGYYSTQATISDFYPKYPNSILQLYCEHCVQWSTSDSSFSCQNCSSSSNYKSAFFLNLVVEVDNNTFSLELTKEESCLFFGECPTLSNDASVLEYIHLLQELCDLKKQLHFGVYYDHSTYFITNTILLQ